MYRLRRALLALSESPIVLIIAATIARVAGITAMTIGVYAPPEGQSLTYIGIGVFLVFSGTVLLWTTIGWYDILWDRIPFPRDLERKFTRK